MPSQGSLRFHLRLPFLSPSRLASYLGLMHSFVWAYSQYSVYYSSSCSQLSYAGWMVDCFLRLDDQRDPDRRGHLFRHRTLSGCPCPLSVIPCPWALWQRRCRRSGPAASMVAIGASRLSSCRASPPTRCRPWDHDHSPKLGSVYLNQSLQQRAELTRHQLPCNS